MSDNSQQGGKPQKEPQKEPQVLTFIEAADMLRCSVRTVRSMAKLGRIQGLSYGGNPNIFTRVTLASIRLFLESRRRTGSPRANKRR